MMVIYYRRVCVRAGLRARMRRFERERAGCVSACTYMLALAGRPAALADGGAVAGDVSLPLWAARPCLSLSRRRSHTCTNVPCGLCRHADPARSGSCAGLYTPVAAAPPFCRLRPTASYSPLLSGPGLSGPPVYRAPVWPAGAAQRMQRSRTRRPHRRPATGDEVSMMCLSRGGARAVGGGAAPPSSRVACARARPVGALRSRGPALCAGSPDLTWRRCWRASMAVT